MSSDLVAYWTISLSDGVHKIEFEHGTTTGKRIIRVDGKEILKREWMFKLVGSEIFSVGTAKCVIRVFLFDNNLNILIYQFFEGTKDLERYPRTLK